MTPEEELSGDLSPLAELKSLQSLDLAGCLNVRRFSALESLLPTLQDLHLWLNSNKGAKTFRGFFATFYS